MSRSDLFDRAAGLPPLLIHVIRAAAYAAKHGPPGERAGQAEALVELGRLAAVSVPARGVLAPIDADLYKAISKIAGDHLHYDKARTTLAAALARVKTFEHRDAIASAHTDVMIAMDNAYYYAGLAWGLTLAELGRKR